MRTHCWCCWPGLGAEEAPGPRPQLPAGASGFRPKEALVMETGRGVGLEGQPKGAHRPAERTPASLIVPVCRASVRRACCSRCTPSGPCLTLLLAAPLPTSPSHSPGAGRCEAPPRLTPYHPHRTSMSPSTLVCKTGGCLTCANVRPAVPVDHTQLCRIGHREQGVQAGAWTAPFQHLRNEALDAVGTLGAVFLEPSGRGRHTGERPGPWAVMSPGLAPGAPSAEAGRGEGHLSASCQRSVSTAGWLW